MKKFLVAMGVAAFAFVGCDDSSSVSAGQNDEPSVESSSSSGSKVSEPAEVTSSSSEKVKSSSSNTQSDAKQSSSSEKTGKSSSSSKNIGSSCSSESDGVSSSSVKSESSSSVEDLLSSSSDKTSVSSSSSADELSSSSLVEISSSSEGEGTSSSSGQNIESSSSSASEVNCSVLLEGETGWSWNVPKECRFNPDIDYGSMTDTRDGKVYKTVKIGDYTWMAENLNYYDASDLNVKEKSWCFGKKDNGDSTTCDVAGRFYTWAAAIDSVKLANDADNPLDCGDGKTCVLPDTVYGICPPGWHLPTKSEWQTLFSSVGGSGNAGRNLKSKTGWKDDGVPGNGNGTDAYGFSALPVGYRYVISQFYTGGNYAIFWSASESNYSEANTMYLYYYYTLGYFADKNKTGGCSVRCVKDE